MNLLRFRGKIMGMSLSDLVHLRETQQHTISDTIETMGFTPVSEWLDDVNDVIDAEIRSRIYSLFN